MASYGLVQVRFKRDRPAGQPAEDIMVNTYHVQVTDGGWTSGDRDDFDAAYGTWWLAVKSLFAIQVGPVEMRFYNVPAVAGPMGDPAFVLLRPTRTGTGANSSTLPPQSAITITWKTAIRRRWGRIYLGGLVSAALDDGRVSSAALGVLGPATDTFGTSLRTTGNGIVVWHRATWTPEPVEEWTIDDVFDVQRRRRYDRAFNRQSGSFLV